MRTAIYQPCLLLASFLLPYAVLASSKSASSATDIATPYEAVNALNQYGESVQLQNAQAVVDQYGRLVVAIRINQETVWIVTPYCPTPPYERTHPTPRRILEPITSHSHLVCAGIQPDAIWLVNELQDYGKTILRELDGVVVDASIVASIYRRFLGYDTNSMWKGIGVGAADREEEEASHMGRPLGVCSLLVSRHTTADGSSSSSRGGRIAVHQIDVSGHVRRLPSSQPLAFLAIGRGADIAKDTLKVTNNEDDLERSLLNMFDLAVGAKKLHLHIMTGDGAIESRVLSR